MPASAFDHPGLQQRLQDKMRAGLGYLQRGHYFLYTAGSLFQ